MHEGIGAIQRIEDPTTIRWAGLFAFFFTKDRIIRESSFDLCAQVSFGCVIGDGHKGVVSFTLQHKRTLEVAIGNRTRLAREVNGKVDKALEFVRVGGHPSITLYRKQSPSRRKHKAQRSGTLGQRASKVLKPA